MDFKMFHNFPGIADHLFYFLQQKMLCYKYLSTLVSSKCLNQRRCPPKKAEMDKEGKFCLTTHFRLLENFRNALFDLFEPFDLLRNFLKSNHSNSIFCHCGNLTRTKSQQNNTSLMKKEKMTLKRSSRPFSSQIPNNRIAEFKMKTYYHSTS